MDENHFPASGEDRIGCARQIAAVQPVSIPHAVNEAACRKLRFCVRLADMAHVGAKRLSGDNAGHADRVPHMGIFNGCTAENWRPSS